MNDRSKIVLGVLFFGLLLGLWYADYARIPTRTEKERLTGRILPELIDADLASIARVEIDHGAQSMAFRRGEGGRWQMTKPVDTLGGQALVETFLANLKALRRLGDAATLTKSPADYGLEGSSPTVRLYRDGDKQPFASLQIGNVSQDRRYVRAEGASGVEIVDAQPLSPIELGPEEWRERAVLPVSPLDVVALAVDGPGRALEADRADGRWRLTRPISGPVDLTKLDALLADLVSLQVARDVKGFVADGVKDFAPYGLDSPRLTIRVTPDPKKGTPLSVAIGNDAPGTNGRVFARRGDRPEVLLITGRALEDLGRNSHALRSQKLGEFDPTRVVRIAIEHGGIAYEIVRGEQSWEMTKPSQGRADGRFVAELLTKLADAQATDFLDAAQVAEPGFDRPSATIKLWENAPAGSGQEPADRVALDVVLGRVDRAKKTVYARFPGDPAVAAVPDILMETLPSGPLAFRERTLVTLGPGRIDGIVRDMEGKPRVVLQAVREPGDFANWAMKEPVRAPVEAEAIARLSVLLAGLRAENLIEAETDNPAKYGLDKPWLSVAWGSRAGAGPRRNAPPGGPAAGVLHVGATVGRGSESRYAQLEGGPLVFTLAPQALAILQAELHDRRLFNFSPERITRLEIVQGEESRVWARGPGAPGVPGRWKPESAGDGESPPDSQMEALVNALARLGAVVFTQYDGAIPEAAGLEPPRATFRMTVEGVPAPVVLRVGAGTDRGLVYATTASGASGAVVLVPQAIFDPWVGPPALPSDPFAKDPM